MKQKNFARFVMFICVLVWLALTMVTTGIVKAEDIITLKWNANTEQDLAGYKLYHGTQTATYEAPMILGTQTSYTLNVPGHGEHFFALTAYDTSFNESGFSNEVVHIVDEQAPVAPVGVVKIVVDVNINVSQ